MFLHVFFTPFFFLHAANDPTTAGRIVNPIPAVTSIPGLIHRILEGILKIGIPFLALAIIYSGFLFITARGNSEKLEKAKDSLLYTIIGGAILLGSWAIAQMIESTILGITS
jgi:hypothetical protein